MKIINASYEIIDEILRREILKKLELAGRVCYKSEDRITDNSASRFVQSIIINGHESVLEHFSITVRFIVDRGVSHEIVRHRIASYSQESTRYCNYSKDGFGSEITVIKPLFLLDDTPEYYKWLFACRYAEDAYFALLDQGLMPQEARDVLPMSLKTELVMTADLREWRHFLRLRTSKAAHPQIREVTMPLLKELAEYLPEVFLDILIQD